MNELTIDGKVYVSSKRAAEITGYAKDYIGQMCREGRVEARLVGRAWYVLESSLREHRFGSEDAVSEPVKPEKPSITDTWATLRYEAEPEPAPVMPIPERPSVNAFEQASEALSASETTLEEPRAPSDSLTDLQSAWKDWFSRRELPAPTEEERIEDTERLEEDVPVAYEAPEDPVVVEEAPSHEEEPEVEVEAEVVPIERIRATPRNYIPNPLPVDPIDEAIVYERPVVRRRRKGYKGVTAILVVVSLIAVVVAVAGSGVLDTYVGVVTEHLPGAITGSHVYTR